MVTRLIGLVKHPGFLDENEMDELSSQHNGFRLEEADDIA